MRKRDCPTTEYLRQCFDYVDGKLFWKERPRDHFRTTRGWKIFNSQRAGNEAGMLAYVSGKYRIPRWRIVINKKSYYRSCIVFAIHNNGYDIRKDVDHKYGDTLNDRIGNLRECGRNQSQQNQKIRVDNTSGFKGVYFNNRYKKYVASICVNKNRIHLGYFDTAKEAGMAYEVSAKKYFGEFARKI